jgi:hypothetical protein
VIKLLKIIEAQWKKKKRGHTQEFIGIIKGKWKET